MSRTDPNALTSVSPDFDEDPPPLVINRDPSPATSNAHADLFRSLSAMLATYNSSLAECERNDGSVVISHATLCHHVTIITRALDHIGPAPRYDRPEFRMIVPPEVTDASSLGRSAATLDMTKVRLLLASSTLSLNDLNSYAQLITAEQDAYRRAHRRSLPLDERAAAIYTPDDDQANKFVDDNPYIFHNFASAIRVDQYFHILKVFTHESATDGKTSSKLLSMIGKYALKSTTYRMSYINGESYAFAKERVYKYLDDDAIYAKARQTEMADYIVVGSDYYKHDREIILQTVYALFGLFYALKGENGLILLNDHIQWFDNSLNFI